MAKNPRNDFPLKLHQLRFRNAQFPIFVLYNFVEKIVKPS